MVKYGTFRVSAVVRIEWLSFSDCQPSVVLKTIATPLKDHKDAYYTQCKLS